MTDADPALVFDAADKVGDMLEAVADRAALSRSVFNDRRHSAGRLQRQVDRFGDEIEAPGFPRQVLVVPRMEVEGGESQQLTAPHLVDKGFPGFFQPFGLRVAEVDQVAVVGKDMFGSVPFSRQLAVNAAICSVFSGAACHCLWFLVNRAKALAPISAAFSGAC